MKLALTRNSYAANYNMNLGIITLIFLMFSCNDNKIEIEKKYRNFNIYFGDLHNHNSVGYAKGSLQRSFDIARSHLDFYALTPHSQWHDIPIMEENRQLFWEKGFEKTKDQWEDVQQMVKEYHDPGSFVTFSGFEWHSSFYGDYCLISKEDDLPLKLFFWLSAL